MLCIDGQNGSASRPIFMVSLLILATIAGHDLSPSYRIPTRLDYLKMPRKRGHHDGYGTPGSLRHPTRHHGDPASGPRLRQTGCARYPRDCPSGSRRTQYSGRPLSGSAARRRAPRHSVCGGSKVPATQAALVNGTAAISHNFTDTTLSCVIHAGPVTVPAALAVG